MQETREPLETTGSVDTKEDSNFLDQPKYINLSTDFITLRYN